MQSDKKVQILMSTYNGERYLAEQLDSIFRQTWPNIEVLVRDDGSKDATLEILKKYQEQHENLYVFPGKNEGLTRSFLELIQNAMRIMWRFQTRMITGWKIRSRLR